ncbi:FtsQ-type POTRA domain-containing protein [Paenibacillus sp. JX-17]|uniref:Cell division protein DivIB n=1 Tax=Paenibacillus lacisoli TaxID=3064525 RepID=A0ABT9C851_9BACL|nr:FtsQ-type POTRA domain-containing protein [Paenibacillus sp. JX-17]MDO7905401.1 FtsQ-type POTRA domain-containing protein [Paenibacillus sp. JX-17]
MSKQLPVLKQDKPKMRTSRKIAFILILLFIVLLAVLFFRSSMSKISEVRIEGSRFYSSEKLLQQSGLHVGEQFFGTSAADVEHRLEKLDSIEKAVVDKQFPGVFEIKVQDYATVAYEISDDGLKAILANGSSKPVTGSGIAVEKPILTQWGDKPDLKAKLSHILASIPNELTSDISEIIPSPTASFPDRIKMYTRSQFEVITAISLLPNKISYLNQVTQSEEPGQITMLKADSYVPFKPQDTAADEENQATQ